MNNPRITAEFYEKTSKKEVECFMKAMKICFKNPLFEVLTIKEVLAYTEHYAFPEGKGYEFETLNVAFHEYDYEREYVILISKKEKPVGKITLTTEVEVDE